MGDGATHVQYFWGQYPSHQNRGVSPSLLHRMAMSTQCRGEFATQGNGRQVDIRYLCERLVISPGIRISRGCSFQKAAWIWLVIILGAKWPKIGMAPVGSIKFQHSPQAGIPNEYDIGISRFFSGNNGTNCHRNLSQVLFRFMRCYHFTFGRCTIPSGNQGCCHLSEFLLQRIWGQLLSSFAGHYGALINISVSLWDMLESRIMPYGPSPRGG